MSDRSFIRPIRIPGKRFVLTKNMIEESQSHTKSNMEAARWLKVSYNTYKKWAKYYKIFEQHLNQSGVGVKKGWATYRIPLEEIFEGKRKCNYTLAMLKKRMVEDGYAKEASLIHLKYDQLIEEANEKASFEIQESTNKEDIQDIQETLKDELESLEEQR